MKYVRATARVDAERAPAFFNLLANSPEIEEARALEIHTTIDGVDNYLFAIEGDPTAFAERATETPGVESVELSDTVGERTYALVVVDSLETPMYDAIQRASARSGFVVRLPIVYRDGKMYGQGVGDPEPLQRMIDGTPDQIDIRIDEISRFPNGHEEPVASLSERQREALAAALALGYYEQPRRATHEDVADELGCAPQTASDHLQKAEAHLVRSVMGEFGPTV